jgi:hypothetical protein
VLVDQRVLMALSITLGPASKLKSSIGTVMRSPLRAPGRIHSTVTNRALVAESCSISGRGGICRDGRWNGNKCQLDCGFVFRSAH